MHAVSRLTFLPPPRTRSTPTCATRIQSTPVPYHSIYWSHMSANVPASCRSACYSRRVTLSSPAWWSPRFGQGAGSINSWREKIRHALRLGNTCTPTQDIECGVNQLVAMAVRSMSPAINDPFTAMTCLDYTGESVALFIRQDGKSSHYYKLEGRLRLVFESVTF